MDRITEAGTNDEISRVLANEFINYFQEFVDLKDIQEFSANVEEVAKKIISEELDDIKEPPFGFCSTLRF